MVQIILAAIVGLAVGSFLTHIFKEPYESQESGVRTHETPDIAPPRPEPSVKE